MKVVETWQRDWPAMTFALQSWGGKSSNRLALTLHGQATRNWIPTQDGALCGVVLLLKAKQSLHPGHIHLLGVVEYRGAARTSEISEWRENFTLQDLVQLKRWTSHDPGVNTKHDWLWNNVEINAGQCFMDVKSARLRFLRRPIYSQGHRCRERPGWITHLVTTFSGNLTLSVLTLVCPDRGVA